MEDKKTLIGGILESYEACVSGIVLYCITELPFPLGVKRIIDLIKGNRSSYIINNELHLLASFSTLPGFTRDQLSDLIDLFINKGLLRVEMFVDDGEETPVVSITPAGRKYLEGQISEPLHILDILMDKDNPDIAEDDQDLYYKLKLARRQLAEEYDYPAFMVCSEKVLREMCDKKPMEPDDLLKIKGVDMAFMKHYSKQFLYVIRQYVTREKGS
jgi:ATP-dependent DNA helicase RecQ